MVPQEKLIPLLSAQSERLGTSVYLAAIVDLVLPASRRSIVKMNDSKLSYVCGGLYTIIRMFQYLICV